MFDGRPCAVELSARLARRSWRKWRRWRRGKRGREEEARGGGRDEGVRGEEAEELMRLNV